MTADPESDLVTRSAPAWAWEIIDRVLSDRADWRNTTDGPPIIGLALRAMVLACDVADDEPIAMTDPRLTADS